MAKDTKQMGAAVPEEEYEFFREQFPIYGATQWFINTALKAFNDKIRENPSLKEHVEESITDMLSTNKAKE